MFLFPLIVLSELKKEYINYKKRVSEIYCFHVV